MITDPIEAFIQDEILPLARELKADDFYWRGNGQAVFRWKAIHHRELKLAHLKIHERYTARLGYPPHLEMDSWSPDGRFAINVEITFWSEVLIQHRCLLQPSWW